METPRTQEEDSLHIAYAACVQALGLKKMHSTVVKEDNAAIRGMIFKVKHLVTVEEVD